MSASKPDEPRAGTETAAGDGHPHQPSEERIAAGLAELAAAAELLRGLDLDDAEPETAFDAGWSGEASR
jgi:hypothetical protein